MERTEKDEDSQDKSDEMMIESDEDNQNDEVKSSREKSLDYLLKQAEVYAHFVTNGSKSNNNNNNKKRKAATIVSTAKRARKHNTSNAEHDNETTVKVQTQFDETPSYITVEMRDYQIRALNWLITLYENGINGILADEMGLGKTLQSISMLGYLKHYEQIHGPHLVVAPNSTLINWSKEIKKFCPSLLAVILIGDKHARATTLNEMISKPNSWNVCITSYEMILMEKVPLKRMHWKYVIIDEAHRIKNEKSKLSVILRSFRSDNRLLLTGTPLQNNLHELWALLNYLLPNVFASADDFDEWFDSDNCLRGNNDIVKRLHTILRPFMLRRVKSEVEKSLLPKKQIKLFVGLTQLQRETYKKVLMKDIQRINMMGETSQKAVNMILVELRKAANHPYLIDGIEPGPPYTTDQHLVDACGKMMLLDKLLPKLQSQGSRVVLFSQFVIMLDIIEDYLVWKGYKYCRIDGNDKCDDRGERIDDFNAKNSDKFIFILSTRAGGLGINLTTADTVIIYDSDWNPQMDFQAIDRVHRIGQKKQVRVFRLITENTVDERIVQRAEIKQRLDKMIIHQGRQIDSDSMPTKGMKADMIRFGAKNILSSEGSYIIDVDIDKILEEGELKTVEEDTKLAKLGENQLRHLTLEEASSQSLYQFEGVDFRSMQKESNDEDGVYTFRQRKTVSYGMPIVNAEPVPKPPPRNMKLLYDFQFYPQALLELSEERDRWIDLNVDTEHKNLLLSEGFPTWNRSDLKLFIHAMAAVGRNNLDEIAKLLPDKTLDEVAKYHRTFWARGQNEINEFKRLIGPLLKKENEDKRLVTIPDAFLWKMTSQRNLEIEPLNIRYKSNSKFTKEQDKLLLVLLFKHGLDKPNVYSCIRHEIQVSKRYNFDFFLRSRTAAEIEKHIKQLMKEINREYQEKVIAKRPNGATSSTAASHVANSS